MSIELEAGSIAVVTGAAGGIGLAICEAIVKAGAGIACLDRPGVDTVAVLKLCEEHGVAGAAWPVDVTEPAALRDAVREAAGLGEVRYAVNCAGISENAPSATMPPEQWQRLIDIDLSGVFYACQAELAEMERSSGSIVNIASMSGSIINRSDPSIGYFAAKAGVVHLSKALGVERARRGVRVNSISPGYTATEMTGKNPPEINRAFCADTPMGRMAAPAEIAAPVVFLLSEAASFVTATDLLVDGGYTAW